MERLSKNVAFIVSMKETDGLRFADVLNFIRRFLAKISGGKDALFADA